MNKKEIDKEQELLNKYKGSLVLVRRPANILRIKRTGMLGKITEDKETGPVARVIMENLLNAPAYYFVVLSKTYKDGDPGPRNENFLYSLSHEVFLMTQAGDVPVYIEVNAYENNRKERDEMLDNINKLSSLFEPHPVISVDKYKNEIFNVDQFEGVLTEIIEESVGDYIKEFTEYMKKNWKSIQGAFTVLDTDTK